MVSNPLDMRDPSLIIFDCDGVLIDSEIVVCRLVSEEFTRLGYPVTTADIIARFAGRPEREMIADIERDWGRAVPADYFSRIKARVTEAYATELRPIPGAAEVLGALQVPFCVASSADPAKLKLGLQSAGLYDRLASNLISASFVARGKPAPDVFIYAAGWMRTPVENCLVVEDSVAGTRAAHAAGIRVIGFSGGAHCSPSHDQSLVEAGAERVIGSLLDLRDHVPGAFAPMAATSSASQAMEPAITGY